MVWARVFRLCLSAFAHPPPLLFPPLHLPGSCQPDPGKTSQTMAASGLVCSENSRPSLHLALHAAKRQLWHRVRDCRACPTPRS